MNWQTYQTPKRGCSEEEYEDAYGANEAAGRFALADGATTSDNAASWARALVDGFVGSAAVSPRRWVRGLGALGQDWEDRLARQEAGRTLAWFVEDKRGEGAFATVLGLAIQARRWPLGNRWAAVAVGDTCLFLIRGGRLARAFPLKRSRDFHNHPDLVGTRDASPPRARHVRGWWRPGDRFLLMTDALAQWFSRGVENGTRPWEALGEATATAGGFPTWVESRRDARELTNDDVTLLDIRL